MDAQVVQKTTFSLSDLKLYVYGSREADQFWIPTGSSHSRKPFCLTDVENFGINNEDDEQESGNSKKQPIKNPLFQQAVYKIACGSLHSVVLTTDGRVFTFGCNDEGALGRQGTECMPFQVALEDPIDLIAAGDNHSLFANSVNGAIYFTGNYNYKKGQKMTASVYKPTRIYASEINIRNKNKTIQKLSCGANHSCVLIGGKIFCRGEPDASTTGRRVSKRHKVENSLTFNGVRLSDVTDIECGGYHTVARVEKNGKILYYSWGTNDHGQLGIGTFESQPYPVQIKRIRGKNMVQISAGASFTLFLDEDGELYGCGNNEDSNLGVGDDFQPPLYGQPESLVNNEEESKQKQEKEHEMSEENVPQLKNMVNEIKNEDKAQQNKNLNEANKDKVSQGPKQSVVPADEMKTERERKLAANKSTYLPSVVQIQLPEVVEKIATGDNFGLAWNKENLYTWGMGYGYVLLNGEENDEQKPFQVKRKIINYHTIFQLDAGNQHVVYTSYPSTIKQDVKVTPIPSVWQNLSAAKLKRKR